MVNSHPQLGDAHKSGNFPSDWCPLKIGAAREDMIEIKVRRSILS